MTAKLITSESESLLEEFALINNILAHRQLLSIIFGD